MKLHLTNSGKALPDSTKQDLLQENGCWKMFVVKWRGSFELWSIGVIRKHKLMPYRIIGHYH